MQPLPEEKQELYENYKALEDKYGWIYQGNCCKQCCCHLYIILSTIFLSIFYVLPFMLIEIIIYIIFIIISWCSCRRCTIEQCFADRMLSYLVIPHKNRGCCWYIGYRLISFWQYVYGIYHIGKDNKFNKMFEEKYKKVDKNANGYPWINGIVFIDDVDGIELQVNSVNQIKNGSFAGIELTPENDTVLYGDIHELNNDDHRYQILRDIRVLAAKVDISFSHINTFKLVPDNFLNKYFTNINVVKQHFKQIHMGLMIYYSFGVMLETNELDYIASKMNNYISSKFMPDFVSKLIGNNTIRRRGFRYIYYLSDLFLNDNRFKETNKHKLLMEHIKKNNIHPRAAFYSIAELITVAGGRANLEFITGRYENDKDAEIKLYNEHGINYIYEMHTYFLTAPLVFSWSKEPKKMRINNNTYVIPENTLLGASIFNHSHTVYNSKEFNPKNDYSKLLAWNGTESEILKNKGKPRFCPGHDISFLVANAFIKKLFVIK